MRRWIRRVNWMPHCRDKIEKSEKSQQTENRRKNEENQREDEWHMRSWGHDQWRKLTSTSWRMMSYSWQSRQRLQVTFLTHIFLAEVEQNFRFSNARETGSATEWSTGWIDNGWVLFGFGQFFRFWPFLDALTDASTLELLYELVSRATSMIQTYTRRVKEEQNFRQALLTTMKVAKKEQTEIVSEIIFTLMCFIDEKICIDCILVKNVKFFSR